MHYIYKHYIRDVMLWRCRKDPVIKYWFRLSEKAASEVETLIVTMGIEAFGMDINCDVHYESVLEDRVDLV